MLVTKLNITYRVFIKERHKVKSNYTAKICKFETEKKRFLQTKNSDHLIIYINFHQYFIKDSILKTSISKNVHSRFYIPFLEFEIFDSDRFILFKH